MTAAKSLILFIVCMIISFSAAADITSNPLTAKTTEINSAIPVDSWQYNAVLRLYNSGITGELSDNDLSGGKVFTRMQMAKFICAAEAQIHKEQKLISSSDVKLLNKLASCYAPDIKALGLDYSKLEETTSDTVLDSLAEDKYWFPKFSFIAEVDLDTYLSKNPASNSANANSINVNGYPGTFNPDVYLQMQINGRMSDAWFYYAELRLDPGSVDVSGNGLVAQPLLRQLEAFGPVYGTATYSNANAANAPQGGEPTQNYFGQPFGITAYIGRMADQLPFNDNTGNQGIVIDNHMTGFRFAMPGNLWSGDVFCGYEDSQFSNYCGYGTADDPLNAFMTGADVGYYLSEDTQLFGGYYQFWGFNGSSKAWSAQAPLQFFEAGVEQAFGEFTQLTVYACGSPNYSIQTLSPYAPEDAPSMYNTSWMDRTGILARLSYGSYNQTQPGTLSVYGQGSCIGAGAIWGGSDVNAANYDNEIYQPNRVLGAVGYEIGVNWALIKNSDLLLSFSQTWPKNSPAEGSQWLQDNNGNAELYDSNATTAYSIAKCEWSFFF